MSKHPIIQQLAFLKREYVITGFYLGVTVHNIVTVGFQRRGFAHSIIGPIQDHLTAQSNVVVEIESSSILV